MSILVKPLVPGDWLRSEAQNRRSREVKTVLSGQVIKCGQVVVKNSDGKMIAVAATGNETHTITFTGTSTAGTFRVSMWHPDGYWVQTADIPYNESQANVIIALNQALIQANSGAVTSSVTGAGTAISAMTIVYSGTGFASKVFPKAQVDFSNATGYTAVAVTRSTSAGAARNEVQTITFGAAATGGTFKLGIAIPDTTLPIEQWAVVWTDTIAWSATDATLLGNINTALDSLLGASKIVATAIAATDTDLGFVLTFSGTNYLGIAHPAVQVDAAAYTSVTTSVVTRTTSGGVAGNRVGNKAYGIAYEAVDASLADTTGLFITREAVVDKDMVILAGGDPDAVETALLERGIQMLTESAYRMLQVN